MDREDNWEESQNSRNVEHDYDLIQLTKRNRTPALNGLNRYSTNTREDPKDATVFEEDSIRSVIKQTHRRSASE